MKIRPYADSDWEDVRGIYDLSKPDELRGAVDVSMILPLDQDPSMLALFRDSTIAVAEEGGHVIGFAGNKGNYISWLFVHPVHRRRGVARELLGEVMGQLRGPITLNVAAENQPARQLYASLGFEVAKDFTGTFNGHDIRVLTLSYEQAG